MNPTPYSLLELIRDDDFITWVRQPTAENSRKWEAYLENYPDHRNMLELARQYVDIIAEDTGRDLPTMKQSRNMWQNVKNTISSENNQN